MTGEGDRYSAGMEGDKKNPSIYLFLVAGLFLLTSFNLSAQRKSDIGFFAGTSYYMGDLNPSVHYAAPSFATGPIFRYNFNGRNSIRFHGFYHTLRGSDPSYSGYISPGQVTEFDAKFVDLGLDFEFNWKKYKTAHRKTKASPYVFAGLGYGLLISNTNDELRSHVNMPFGIGYKINLGKWLSAGVEASARKVFSDRVDGLTNPDVEGLSVAVNPAFGNNDWYFFTGIFITYKIFKFWEDCPTYD